MPTFDEVAELVRKRTGHAGPLTPATTLRDDLGVYGNVMTDLMADYAKRFGVEMSGYLWYFHSAEEGVNPLWAVFPPPNARVPHVKVTN